MSKVELLEKIRQLGFSVKEISKHSKIPEARIYKWYKGTGLPKFEDYNKLLDLYEQFKKAPTNDFASVQEQEYAYKLPEPKKEWIDVVNDIVHSMGIVASSNKILAESNKTLTDLLKDKAAPAPQVSLNAPANNAAMLQPYLHQLAAGLGNKLSIDQSDLLAEMGKILLKNHVKNSSPGSRDGKGN